MKLLATTDKLCYCELSHDEFKKLSGLSAVNLKAGSIVDITLLKQLGKLMDVSPAWIETTRQQAENLLTSLSAIQDRTKDAGTPDTKA